LSRVARHNTSMSAPPPKSDSARSEPTPELSPLGIAAIFFAACNVLGPPFVVSILRGSGDDGAMFLLSVGLGIVLAEFAVLPAWLVWGDRPFWQRLLIHWSVASGLSLAWMLGMAMAAGASGPGPLPSDFLQIVAMLFLCLPAVSLGIEAPLWATRFFFGWRFGRASELQAERPLAISDLLWGMAVISAALAAVRLAAAIDFSGQPDGMWLPLAMTAGSAAITSLLALLPLTWCILRVKEFSTGIIVVIGYTLAAWVAFAAIVSSLSGDFGPDARPLVAILLFLCIFAATTCGALGLARKAGYRLQVGRRGGNPA
jgi:hypothetical protein